MYYHHVEFDKINDQWHQTAFQEGQMKRYFIRLISLFFIMMLFTSCLTANWLIMKGNNPKIGDVPVTIFKGTEIYDFALLVDKEDCKAIQRELPKYRDLIDTVESKETDSRHLNLKLLHWAVGKKKYKALECLLKAGVNPNVLLEKKKCTPLYVAVYNSRNYGINETDKFIKLLIKYNADPNLGKSFLWCLPGEATPGDLKKIKWIAENSNVDFNLYNDTFGKPLYMYFIQSKSYQLDIARYLIFDCGVNIDCNFYLDLQHKEAGELTNSIDYINRLRNRRYYKFKDNKVFLEIVEKVNEHNK